MHPLLSLSPPPLTPHPHLSQTLSVGLHGAQDFRAGNLCHLISTSLHVVTLRIIVMLHLKVKTKKKKLINKSEDQHIICNITLFSFLLQFISAYYLYFKWGHFPLSLIIYACSRNTYTWEKKNQGPKLQPEAGWFPYLQITTGFLHSKLSPWFNKIPNDIQKWELTIYI